MSTKAHGPAGGVASNPDTGCPGGNGIDSAEDGVHWYALHVKTRFERMVSRNLRAKGYEEYLPLCRRSARWSDRTKQIEYPLFPGYIFCRLNPVHRLPVLMIPGVQAVVGIGRRLVPVAECELDAIRGVLRSGAHCEPCPFLEVGQRVRVEAGPLAGLQGFVTRVGRTHRLVISVELLRRSVAVEIDEECLRPIAETVEPSEQQTQPVPVQGVA